MARTDTYNHESIWPQLRKSIEKLGAQGLFATIQKVNDPYERVSLFRFAIRGLMFRDWEGKHLDPVVQVAEKAVEETLNSAEQSTEDRDWFTDQANIICYNMASNLADCWNDGLERSKHHFHLGLRFAERAIGFREKLGKGPLPFFMAYWAKGIHQLFLGQFNEGLESLERSAQYAADSAKTQGKSAEVDEYAPFEVVLASGYLAIAQMLARKSDAQAQFDQALRAFENMKALSPEFKEDAEIGMDQLSFARKRFGALL